MHHQIRFENTDVLVFLKTIESNSVDYINTDPPYYIGFDDGQGWDSQWETEQDYLDWCAAWTTELVRVLKPGRMLSVWGTLKTDTFLKYKLDILNSFEEMEPQTEIVWSYNWGGRTKKNFARKHEYAWNYSKGTEFLFNADDVRVARKMQNNPRTGEAYTRGTIPTAIWEQNNHTGSKDFVNWHPTTKNIDVLTRMIQAYSNVGDTILDCFGGSGSTGLAAVRGGRKYIGCEAHFPYYEKALNRILAG